MKEFLYFIKEGKHLILFGGKGGVGKTSIAAATSIKCSEMGLKTLITSSDPAHSLSDVFEQESIIGGEITAVNGYNNLYALETDPKKVLDEYSHYLEEYPELKLLLGEDFEEFPGANEGFGLLNLIRRFNNEDWDIVIVDTAPTGHTLKLLSFPDFLSKTTVKLIRIRSALGSFVDKITSFFRRRKEEHKDISDFLDIAKDWSEETKKILSNQKVSKFMVVLIPELLSINETERLISNLKIYNIPIGGIFVNKFFPKNTTCSFCLKKRSLQDENFEMIEKKFGDDFQIKKIKFFEDEIHGNKMLENLKEILYES